MAYGCGCSKNVEVNGLGRLGVLLQGYGDANYSPTPTLRGFRGLGTVELEATGNATGLDEGPENLLAREDGDLASDLRDRLDQALRYIANWYKGTEGSPNKLTWWAQIDTVRAKVEDAETAMDPSKIFPGTTELALYDDAAAAFPDLWRTLTLSPELNGQVTLFSALADLPTTILQTPSYIVQQVANGVTDLAGPALAQASKSIMPYALAAGGVLAAIVLGPTLIGLFKGGSRAASVVTNPRRRRRRR
jgi:hypothetical protein